MNFLYPKMTKEEYIEFYKEQNFALIETCEVVPCTCNEDSCPRWKLDIQKELREDLSKNDLKFLNWNSK
jgi:hypothetical protein